MNLSPTTIQGELPPAPIVVSAAIPSVGDVRADLSDVSCVEDELDRAIAELGQRSERAMADGDPAGARIYTDRMMAAIRSRTPEHQARLTAEAEARIEEARITNGVDYFQSPAALELGRRRVG